MAEVIAAIMLIEDLHKYNDWLWRYSFNILSIVSKVALAVAMLIFVCKMYHSTVKEPTTENLLAEARDMRDGGYIDNAEYERRRAEIIANI